MKPIVVLTTVATLADARALARSLVEARLAACAHISPIESFYHWQGALQNEPEFSVAFKTSAEEYPRIEAAIRAQHPYQLPDIHALPLTQIYEPYARWLEQSLQSAAPAQERSAASP